MHESSTNKHVMKSFGILFLSRHVQAFRLSMMRLSINPLATVMTFLVIGVALALPMGLYVLLNNIYGTVENIHQDTTKFSVYLKKDVTLTAANNAVAILAKDADVAKAYYISPEEGMREFQKYLDAGNLMAGMTNNPLPGVIVIQQKEAVPNEELLERIKKIPAVDFVQQDIAWLKKLNALYNLGEKIVYSIFALFALAVLLIIGNTIRLSAQKYQREIAINKLLGATMDFIRRPFLYVGIIYGLAGSIIAWLMVDLIVWWLQKPAKQLAMVYGGEFHLRNIDLQATMLLIVSGIVLGYLGSRLVVDRQIRISEIDY